MANTLDPMDLKQIISLHLDRFSNRKIAETLSISRNTVNTYMRLFKDRLATLNFMTRKENIIITGASGVGKSYLGRFGSKQIPL